MRTVEVRKRVFSEGAGAYEHPVSRRLVPLYNCPWDQRTIVHRVTSRYVLYVVTVDGRRADAFLKKPNADKLAKRLRAQAMQVRLDADNAKLLRQWRAGR